MSAHGSASDPWTGWNSQPGQSAVGEAAQDVQSTPPSAAENPGSAESNSMSQGDSVTSGNTWDRSWDASNHWSWTDYGRSSSWGDAWGQSYWGPSWSSSKTGGWRRPEYEDRSWGYGAQQGHFGQTRQGSDEGGEVHSNNSSDGAARTPEPGSSEQDDHPDASHEEPHSRAGSEGTSTTRVPGSDRDVPGGADGKGASFGEKMSVPTFDAEGPRWLAGLPGLDPGKPTGIRGAYLTGIDEENDASVAGPEDPGDEGMSEETAFELHEAFVASETAKQRYREVAKARGVDPAVLGSRSDPKVLSDEALKQSVEQRLQAAKQRSFCAGCHRRGHWHKDPECPLNRGAQSSNKPPPAKNVHVTDAVAGDVSDGSVVQVAFEVGVEPSGQLLAITDTACSKSVAGQSWLNDYLKAARVSGTEVQLIDSQDDFRFGASKLFRSTFTATIMIRVGHRSFLVRASVVHGEVPLLLSRSVLSGLGMIYDVEDSKADFKRLNIHGHNLSSTDSGHPAIVVKPEGIPGFRFPTRDQWGSAELYIVPESTTAYTVQMSSAASESIERLQLPEDYRIFYPKKIHAFVENFLSAEPMNTDIFIRWWCQTKLSKDFWIENKSQLIRVHIVPRRGLFSPSDWVTTQGEVKDRLLGVVGPVRTTNGISCQSHHPLQNLHDVWEDEAGQGFPTLWIGRTVFSRRAVSGRTSSLPSSTVDPHGSSSPQ
ncbi:GIP [Symbiodinium microadriaticum]|nr:GIP [Symbiodinium microadriaticum]